MTWEEFVEQGEVHSECENDQSEWYEEPEADNAGMCIECGCEYTLVNWDPSSRTVLFECYDCGAMWDEWRCARD